ncbi:hypothetical protein ACRAWD_28285 [Caulobacter segnis]
MFRACSASRSASALQVVGMARQLASDVLEFLVGDRLAAGAVLLDLLGAVGRIAQADGFLAHLPGPGAHPGPRLARSGQQCRLHRLDPGALAFPAGLFADATGVLGRKAGLLGGHAGGGL